MALPLTQKHYPSVQCDECQIVRAINQDVADGNLRRPFSYVYGVFEAAFSSGCLALTGQSCAELKLVR